ncbi:hypothetical protein PPERSA_02383 [Pseudocohnilembus persalinus]|uniref:Uncharacterized protein n=1 Tax=Pseudocohnilembus persalinus TaxID=266149 RepID=A0A0V0Q8U5_PSEPJ|nr:hypothetical protein PPERSA_02383 [Pseudocohnilembus persalinus]|eukprot:KRW98575.1 hypothetical protein PPERSA_02383 [Pseudocohnilembus persalinus]
MKNYSTNEKNNILLVYNLQENSQNAEIKNEIQYSQKQQNYDDSLEYLIQQNKKQYKQNDFTTINNKKLHEKNYLITSSQNFDFNRNNSNQNNNTLEYDQIKYSNLQNINKITPISSQINQKQQENEQQSKQKQIQKEQSNFKNNYYCDDQDDLLEADEDESEEFYIENVKTKNTRKYTKRVKQQNEHSIYKIEESESYKKSPKKLYSTKNIPKTYINALISYALSDEIKNYIKEQLRQKQFTFNHFQQFLKKMSRNPVITKMKQCCSQVAQMGNPKHEEFARLIRIVFFRFLRREKLSYFINKKKVERKIQTSSFYRNFKELVYFPDQFQSLRNSFGGQ